MVLASLVVVLTPTKADAVITAARPTIIWNIIFKLFFSHVIICPTTLTSTSSAYGLANHKRFLSINNSGVRVRVLRLDLISAYVIDVPSHFQFEVDRREKTQNTSI
jgi:hypothetical protein